MDKRIYITIFLVAAFTLYQIYAAYQALQAGSVAGLISPIMYVGIIGLIINQLMLSNLRSDFMRRFTLPQVIRFSFYLSLGLMMLYAITLALNLMYGILFSAIFSGLLLYSSYNAYKQAATLKNQYGIK
ncbi:hypothetical protein ERX27_10275 [Macrococcus brunensis]|uniref:Uncharacterized protein n=1 Tax=Macrococcus brunensis TaxID=198483 RepID=A0A4R6BAV7_9STAP|nr:hypothetical protein [Macrococcus brunensis]TDL93445.1 hypothetical protein ERX27_10275 [Macrococcus brunensis]ULG72379.1 hypothetical protein MGG12_02335 [Macrococcus brunensis]ULG74640.1 hypothetical protein MGG13_02415 [Macrococcus brunensis]